MSILPESWQHFADTTGFRDEKEMLHSFYLEQKLSINQIAEVLGVSTGAVRRRLRLADIPLRGRGGKNRIGVGKVQLLTDAELASLDSREKCIGSGFHPSAIYKEKKRRQNALRANPTHEGSPAIT